MFLLILIALASEVVDASLHFSGGLHPSAWNAHPDPWPNFDPLGNLRRVEVLLEVVENPPLHVRHAPESRTVEVSRSCGCPYGVLGEVAVCHKKSKAEMRSIERQQAVHIRAADRTVSGSVLYLHGDYATPECSMSIHRDQVNPAIRRVYVSGAFYGKVHSRKTLGNESFKLVGGE